MHATIHGISCRHIIYADFCMLRSSIFHLYSLLLRLLIVAYIDYLTDIDISTDNAILAMHARTQAAWTNCLLPVESRDFVIAISIHIVKGRYNAVRANRVSSLSLVSR
jgi:hypothetical protein